MAKSLDQLKLDRAQIINEIKRRGGKEKAPGFTQQLTALDAQINQMRSAPAGKPGTGKQPAGPPATNNPAPGAGAPGGAPGVTGGGVFVVPDEKKVVKEAGAIKDTKTAVRAELDAEDLRVAKDIQANNPNISGPTGSQNVTRDANGNIVVNQKLSDDQQAILDKDEGLSKLGRDLATQQLNAGGFNKTFAPEVAQRTTTGDLNSDRARIEDEVFRRLTRDVDQEYTNAKEAKAAELRNRGVPYSDNPASRYQQELTGIDKRFDTIKTDARQRAAEVGGQEFERSFGIGEQLISNQIGQAQTVRNQRLGEAGTLSSLGSGLLLPNFQQFQGSQYNPASPLETYATIQGLNDADKDRALTEALARMKAGGGGGRTGTTAAEQSPFFSSAPPGL